MCTLFLHNGAEPSYSHLLRNLHFHAHTRILPNRPPFSPLGLIVLFRFSNVKTLIFRTQPVMSFFASMLVIFKWLLVSISLMVPIPSPPYVPLLALVRLMSPFNYFFLMSCLLLCCRKFFLYSSHYQ